MKFVLYGYAVSLMPKGAWRHFRDNFARFGDSGYFWQKTNILEILCPESVRLTGSETLQNIPEPLAKL